MAIGIVALCVVALACCMCSRIQLALTLSDHAGKAMTDVPSMLVTPAAVFAIFLAFVYYWVYVLAYLLSSGTLILHGAAVSVSQTSHNATATGSRGSTVSSHVR